MVELRNAYGWPRGEMEIRFGVQNEGMPKVMDDYSRSMKCARDKQSFSLAQVSR